MMDSSPLPDLMFLQSSPLVQRTDEVATLRHVLTGPPAVVFVEGEAGIGKTRLVQDVLAGLRSAQPATRVFTGHCQPQQSPFPLLPVVEALQAVEPMLRGTRLSAVAGTLRSLLPELSLVLPAAPEPPGDPAAARHQVFRGLAEVLQAVTPAIVVLEDLHWADVGTLEFLHFLVTQTGRLPHLVLTYRYDDLPPDSLLRPLAARLPAGTMQVRLELGPLDRTGVARLVEGMLHTEVTTEFATLLHQRTDGVPFAVEEMVRLLTDRRDLVRRDGRWARHALSRLEVPRAIRDAITERVSRLPADARRVVDAVAVLGPDATTPAVGQVAGLRSGARLTEALSTAVGSALVRDSGSGRLEFRHDLAREAAYGAIDARRRRELHARAAKALLGVPDIGAARLARHCREAGDPGWVTHAERAAEQMAALGDYRSAYDTLRDVLSDAELDRAHRLRVVRAFGDIALHAQLPTEAAQVLLDALETGGRPRAERAELMFQLALLVFVAGDIGASFGWLQRCVEEADTRTPTAARAMSMLAFPMVERTPVEEHLRWLERSVEAASSLSDEVARTAIEGNAATIRVGLGLIPPSAVDEERHVDRGPSAVLVQQSRVRRNLAEMCLYVGAYAAATRFLDDAVDIDARLGAEPGRDLLALRVYRDLLTGHWAGLPGRADGAERALTRVAQARAVASLSRVVVAARTGRGPAVPAELVSVGEQALGCGSIPVFLQASAATADALLAAGRDADARAACDRALTVVREKGVWVWAAELLVSTTRALMATGDAEGARKVVREAAKGLSGRYAPAAAAALATARGIVAADVAARRRHLAAAEAAWAALPRPYEAACAAELLGRLLSEAPDEGAAAQAWQRALDGYAELGATRDAARVSRALRERGVPVRPHRGGRHGDALSTREREVVDLVAAGHTNREIAERLFLSPRTVEHHVERAMRKLGAQSRTQLGTRATPPVG